jgi:NADPH:quinone reductase
MRAVTVGDVLGRKRLTIGTFEVPTPAANEATVEVKAISLNNGEVRGAFSAPAGYRPGWDLAGVVQAVPPGSIFSIGDRVFGLKFEGAWAEQVVMATTFLAPIPPVISFEQAAALPVAGLTASIALSKKRIGRGGNVLVTALRAGSDSSRCNSRRQKVRM